MDNKTKSCLLFSLSNELFAISVDSVLRVIGIEKIVRVPQAPPFVSGVINHEGNVIPIVDLAKKIELGETGLTDETKIVILTLNKAEGEFQVGVLIDTVLDVAIMDTTKIQPAMHERMGFNTSALDGIYKDNEAFYMILNVNRIFENELESLVQ